MLTSIFFFHTHCYSPFPSTLNPFSSHRWHLLIYWYLHRDGTVWFASGKCIARKLYNCKWYFSWIIRKDKVKIMFPIRIQSKIFNKWIKNWYCEYFTLCLFLQLSGQATYIKWFYYVALLFWNIMRETRSSN